jgi:2-polyprenyl-3-methyl-5-hydroxy-6-metoxy-1,4-benzoquinol methylase
MHRVSCVLLMFAAGAKRIPPRRINWAGICFKGFRAARIQGALAWRRVQSEAVSSECDTMTLFSSVTQRVLEPEVMDDPALDANRHYHALRGLSRINRLSASSRIVFRPLAELARSLNRRRLRVLDIATGSGDIPLDIWRRGRRSGLEFEILGLDVSPRAVEFGTARAEATGANVHFAQVDVFQQPLPEGYDVAMCSLYLHHQDRPHAITLLKTMADAAERMVLVNDLERGPLGLLAAEAVCRLATTSSVVRVDGPRSVRAAFTVSEAASLADEAGLTGAKIERRWPFRYLLTWRKD